MTGQLDVASRVCLGAMAPANGEVLCAGSGSQCCKPLTAVPTSTDGATDRPYVFAATDHTPTVFALALASLEKQSFVASIPQTSQAPAVRVYLARLTNSPPPSWTQFRPIYLAGRAPPVL